MKYNFSDIFQGHDNQETPDYRGVLRRIIEKHNLEYENDKRENNNLKDAAVLAVFRRCKSNSVEDVLAKVSILNNFYNTQLRNYPPDKANIKPYIHMDVVSMAHHIASCSEFDKFIENGKLSAVEYIRDGDSQYRKNYHMKEYSFATKYCSFCAAAIEHHDYYPIVDSFSSDVLYYLNHYLSENGSPFHTPRITRNDLTDYSKYCGIYQDFKKYLTFPGNLNPLSNKAIDKFLWHFGKYPDDKTVE